MIGLSLTANSFVEDCYISPTVAGREIVECKGTIVYIEKSIDGDITDKKAGFLRGLVSEAKKKGANAVVNVRLTIGSYQEMGSGRNKSYVVAYGDAVRLAAKTE